MSELLNLFELLSLDELLDLPGVENIDIFYLLNLGFYPIGWTHEKP